MISAGSAFDGVYVSSDDLQIDGMVTGEILSQGKLLISEGAIVNASVAASQIVVAGRLEGTIQCDGRIEVLPSGWVAGKVSAFAVVIQEGAYFTGELTMRSQRALEAPPKSELLGKLLNRREDGRLYALDFPITAAEPTPHHASSLKTEIGASMDALRDPWGDTDAESVIEL